MTTQELVRIITMGVTAGAVPIILRYILKGKKNKKTMNRTSKRKTRKMALK